ncbi:unnamed protein product [Bursaphelenchus okinawaensis]|uniref:Uncharacterized protein n=1 Tax=Bursaphelenchus okinawaensis TaxID=465554 RepID=A0A811LSZ8_9BILA|nr:unnamed protein product [Bursaphelenchus okinawaensis]CAG9128402.1 unnamed protein product [Bursaphelenchus okinawaensis]
MFHRKIPGGKARKLVKVKKGKSVKVDQMKMANLELKSKRAQSENDRKDAEKEMSQVLERRKNVDELMKNIFGSLDSLDKSVSQEEDCWPKVNQAFNRKCYNFIKNEYLQHFQYKLMTYCNVPLGSKQIIQVLDEKCVNLDKHEVF